MASLSAINVIKRPCHIAYCLVGTVVNHSERVRVVMAEVHASNDVTVLGNQREEHFVEVGIVPVVVPVLLEETRSDVRDDDRLQTTSSKTFQGLGFFTQFFTFVPSSLTLLSVSSSHCSWLAGSGMLVVSSLV